MRARVGRSGWMFGVLVLLSACAARSTPRQTQADVSSAGGDAAKAGPDADERAREMTWEQYYVDVEQRARRSNGVVMWFNPPRLERRNPQQGPASNAPAGGAPLSGTVR